MGTKQIQSNDHKCEWVSSAYQSDAVLRLDRCKVCEKIRVERRFKFGFKLPYMCFPKTSSIKKIEDAIWNDLPNI